MAWAPACGLDVGVLGAEQLLGAVDRQLLGDVDLLAAAVVAAAGVALGVLVGQHRADRFEHRLRHEVLRGDHLQRALLAPQLGVETAAISGSTSASGAVWKLSGRSAHRRATIATGRDSLRPVRARLLVLALALLALALLVASPAAAAIENPCDGPEARHLLCPNLRIGPPSRTLRPERVGGQRAAAGDQRRRAAAAAGRWSCAASATAGARCGPTSGSTASAAATSTVRSDATLRFTDVGAYFGGSYWKVHQLARFELRRVGPDGAARRRRPHQPQAQLLPARPRADPRRAAARPASRHYPGCNQNPYQDRVTLGTSVGWSDIYPADYDKQWINVAGLRGCFAYRMTVDPKELLFESNENDNTSRASSACPSRASPAAKRRLGLAQPRRFTEADGGELARQVAGGEGAVAEDPPAAVLLDRGDVDHGRGQAGQLAAVDRQVGARRRSPPGRRSKRAGAGSPLRLAEVWKTGHIVPASGPPIRRTPSRSGSSRQASG